MDVPSPARVSAPQVADSQRITNAVTMARIAPAFAAIVYPAFLRAVPAVSPIFLALSLVAPAVAVLCVHRLPPELPRARAVALLAAAAPSLYSWLGGLLGFPRMPLSGLEVWFPLWCTLALVAVIERPRTLSLSPRPSTLAFAHGCSAVIILLFAVAHLANHVAGLWGGEQHIAVMSALRTVYRAPAVEAVLLAAIAFQALSGLRLLRPHAERGRSWWDTAQIASGVYLAMFLVSHLTATLRSRAGGVDTDWVWLTSASMLADPWNARLAPHYTLGVIAFGVHAGLGLRYVLRQKGWPPALADRVAMAVPACAAAALALIMTALLAA